ncbi:MAG: GLPGLI family protein [Microscillaceae bacterium]|nr:GLPGLI family protein [Microscillaceae bacterium]
MKKFFLPLALFVLTYRLLAQNIEVDYAVRINRRSPSNSTETRYHLKIKGQESVYFNTLEDSVSRFIFASVQDIEREGARLMAKLDDSHYTFIEEDFLYKNYASGTMEYNEDIQYDLVVIKDPLARFDWQLLPDRDTTILGYPCQRARAEFRGRTYVACFSPALHPFGGPWKFEGLPGLIFAGAK